MTSGQNVKWPDYNRYVRAARDPGAIRGFRFAGPLTLHKPDLTSLISDCTATRGCYTTAELRHFVR